MRRFLNVEQALQLLFEIDEFTESESESEDFDDEVDDPSYVCEEDRDEEQPPAPTCAPNATRRSAQRTGWRGTPTRSRSPLAGTSEPHLSSEPWKTEEEADAAPEVSRFQPRRTPGVQLDTLSSHCPKDLFLLFFATDSVRTICKNTNKNAAKNIESGKKYKWTDINEDDLYKFFGILIYMSLVSLPSFQDYWRQNHILSVPLPSKIMTRDRFRSIFWNIHLSDPEEDRENDRKKGTAGHEKLFRVRPLYEDILSACLAYYHPRRELAVDERMVATRAKTGMTQYMKDKPTKWGIKIFVLAESSSGYTIRFGIYTGKTFATSEHGLSHDIVMSLIQPACLGTGYHIYMDNFYTSPKLFMDLANMKYGACGTYRESRKGCPRGKRNALTKKSERGSVRWIREGPLVFVKWMDTREVSVCSTIHPAFSGETVRRRVKDRDGRWTVKGIPCPTPIIAYNKHMGGVDLSDQLIQYYSTHRKTPCGYRTLLLHFLDIATTNAFILHREICSARQLQSMTHKDFMVELVCQLCGVEKAGVPQSRREDHIPVPIISATDAGQKATKGRLKCKRCREVDNKRTDTPWKCQACDVPLCLILDRNCFFEVKSEEDMSLPQFILSWQH
uniref:PiggyBac transposable element-derived protein domain-containing protein n=1 Tax=Kryptolebias marmoratus TaxID=37003 RepID=A0A3Q3ENX6_KRYMA